MKMVYEKPNMEILEVTVEEGFSASLCWTDEPSSDEFEIEQDSSNQTTHKKTGNFMPSIHKVPGLLLSH